MLQNSEIHLKNDAPLYTSVQAPSENYAIKSLEML